MARTWFVWRWGFRKREKLGVLIGRGPLGAVALGFDFGCPAVGDVLALGGI